MEIGQPATRLQRGQFRLEVEAVEVAQNHNGGVGIGGEQGIDLLRQDRRLSLALRRGGDARRLDRAKAGSLPRATTGAR